MTAQPTTLTLAAFLAARLAEDEAVARDVHPALYAAPGHFGLVADRTESATTRDHIARHDPARVLAEVASKRAIVAKRAELAAYLERIDPLGLHEASSQASAGQFHTLDWVMRQMADVYSEHPDYAAAVAWYDAEWQP